MKEQIALRKSLWCIIIRDRGLLAYLSFLELVSLLVVLLTPQLMRYFVDNVLQVDTSNLFTNVVIGLIALLVLTSIVDIFGTFIQNKIQNLYIQRSKINIMKSINNLSEDTFHTFGTGELKQVLYDDIYIISKLITEQTFNYVFDIIILLACFTFILTTHWILAFTTAAVLVVILVIQKTVINSVKSINQKVRAGKSEHIEWINETFSLKETIKTLSMEKFRSEEYTALQQKLVKLEHERAWKQYFPSHVLLGNFNSQFTSKILIYFICGVFVLTNSLTIGVALVFIKYFGSMVASLSNCISRDAALSRDLPSIKRIKEVAEARHKIRHPSKKDETYVGKDNTAIELQDVTFKYADNENFSLKSINLFVTKGEKLGIVGKSGSGKSTMIKIMVQVYQPNTGMVLLSNDISKMGHHTIPECFSVVFQNPYVINSSIYDFMTLSDHRVTDNEIEESLRLVNMLEFVGRCPDGYNYLIGENANKLSGGQKQLLLMAQSNLRKRNIEFFDEAMSAVDESKRKKLIENLLSQNKTIIYSTQNPELVSRFDRIVYLENGKITDIGTHDSLLQKNKQYRKLCNEARENND